MTDYDLNVLALGAGVQSTCVLLMANEGLLGDPPDLAIFADTQWEPPEVYTQLEWCVAHSSIPIHVVTAGDLRADVLKVVGPPGQKIGRVANPPFYVRRADQEAKETGLAPDDGGKLWRGCTSEYKIEPIHKEIRRYLGYKPHQRVKKRVRQWFGISIDEASRMRDSRVPWIDNYYPLVEQQMSRQDCLKWMRARDYGTPVKSACIGCPYHSNTTWVHMKKHKPHDWADAVDFDHRLRKGKLPGVTGDAYLHRRFKPLEEAILHDYDPNQLPLFDEFEEECEGMCGL